MGNSDSKQAFSTLVEDLKTKPLTAGTTLPWEVLWTNPGSADELLTWLTPVQLRAIAAGPPGNLSAMVAQILRKLRGLLTPKKKQLEETNPLLGERGEFEYVAVEAKEALILMNCVRLLSRIVPCLVELGSEKLANELSFSNEVLPKKGDYASAPTEEASGSKDSSREHGYTIEELAECLTASLMDVLFCEYLTLQPDPKSLIWYPGIASSVPTLQLDLLAANRVEVLQLLLMITSENVFLSTDEFFRRSRPLYRALASYPTHSRDLFFSLLNSVVTHVPGYTMTGAPDNAEQLLVVASQALLLLLDYRPASVKDGPETPRSRSAETLEEPENAPAVGRSADGNQYLELLASITAEEDIARILNGLVSLLRNPLPLLQDGDDGVIMVRRRIECHQELLVLLYKLLEVNPRALEYATSFAGMSDLLEALLVHLYEGRSLPSRIGLLHVGTFILILLSGRRSFSVSLNRQAPKVLLNAIQLRHRTPLRYHDAFIHVLYKIMFNGGKAVVSLYSCILTILSNVSPYVKSLSNRSAEFILVIVERFARRRVLLARENNYLLLKQVLEVVDSIIEYQADNNVEFLYVLLRKSEKLEALYHIDNLLLESEPAASLAEVGKISSIDSDMWDGKGEGDGDAAPFRPTQEWAEKVQSELPLTFLKQLLKTLGPEAETIKNLGKPDALKTLLSTNTLVGLLPLPQPIIVRRFQPHKYTDLWFSAYIWGLTYLRLQEAEYPPLVGADMVKLFKVSVGAKGKHVQQQQPDATSDSKDTKSAA